MPHRFLSCDWGSSSFRLRLVEAEPFRVLAEFRSGEGALVVRRRIEEKGLEAGEAFRAVLRQGIEGVERGAGVVIISGMAGSSIGWKDLGYANVPFPADGSSARWERLGSVEAGGERHRVVLFSGLRTDSDVMRGEETEVIGLLADEKRARFRREALIVLPGTHSKHVSVKDGVVTGFTTFMTGELFSVLSSASILRHSVSPGAPLDEDAYRRGALAARERGLSSALFTVRTNQILQDLDPARNASYLSGLLAGAEVLEAGGAAEGETPIVLSAGRALSSRYALAFEALGLAARVEVIPPEEAETASARGHARLLRSVLGGLSP